MLNLFLKKTLFQLSLLFWLFLSKNLVFYKNLLLIYKIGHIWQVSL